MRMHTTGKEKTKVIHVYCIICDSVRFLSTGPPLCVVSEKLRANVRDIKNATSNMSMLILLKI